MHGSEGARRAGMALAVWCAATAAVLLGAVSAIAAPPRPGDYVVVSRRYGSIYAVDRESGLIRGLVSGAGLRPGESGRGAGLPLTGMPQIYIASGEDGALWCRATTTVGRALVRVDERTGRREVPAGLSLAVWRDSGDLLWLDEETILTTADDFGLAGSARARVLTYNVVTGVTGLVSGPSRGDGPGLSQPRGVTLLDGGRALVVEWQLEATFGTGLFEVDLKTGDRRFVSRMSVGELVRPVFEGGVQVGVVTLGDDEGGAGPVMNQQCRDVELIGGRVVVAHAIRLPDQSFDGGLMEVDVETGDRELLVGRALVDDGVGQTVVVSLPSNADEVFLDAPIGLLEARGGVAAFTNLFGPWGIYEFDLATRELVMVSDVAGQLAAPFDADVELSGLTVYAGACAADWDGNGVVNSADVGGFLTSYFGDLTGGTSETDVDGNGVVNSADVGVMLTEYFQTLGACG